MPTDRDHKTGRAQVTGEDVKDGLLRGMGLMALPVLAFQRNMLNVVRKGIQEAGLLQAVGTLAQHELHALFMILDPKAQWRNSLGVEIEKKLKGAFDSAVPKVISGSVSLIDAQEAILTAFSTASSAGTLPTTLRVAEQNLRLPAHVARFVLTIGASANHHGTALFEGLTTLFLAQCFGVTLDLGQQALLLVLCILASIGTAGVPAGSLPVIAMLLGYLHVPPDGIGLILGVDRLLDMCRTALNVTGDLATAVVVARSEESDGQAAPQGAFLDPAYEPDG